MRGKLDDIFGRFAELVVEQCDMFVGNRFVSDCVEQISKKGIAVLSVIFLELYGSEVQGFLEGHRIKESFARIVLAEFLFPLLIAYRW